jgi:hypothetical protein
MRIRRRGRIEANGQHLRHLYASAQTVAATWPIVPAAGFR